MNKQGMTRTPVCTWVAVTDEAGRTHMEARWAAPGLAHVEAHVEAHIEAHSTAA